MAILAQGREKVRKIQRAMGGEPPKAAITRSRDLLRRYIRQRFESRRASQAEVSRLNNPLRDRVLRKLFTGDAGVKDYAQQTKTLCQRRAKRKIARPRPRKIEAQFVTGSNFQILTPPYDSSWTASHVGEAQASAQNGSYSLGVGSLGNGSAEAAAGVACWFFATDADLQQRFAAVLEYTDDWWDSAFFYVAHNDFTTNLWVWGPSENAWVAQSPVSPSWSDGVSWTETHGNDPQGEAGGIAVETYFNVNAGSWYLCWIWSDASVYADGGIFGTAGSSIQFNGSVPMMVFGSL